MNYKKYLTYVFCLSAWMSTQAQPLLRIGVPNAAYPPYVLTDEQQQVTGGFLLDALQPSFAKVGFGLELQLLPSLRAQQMMSTEEIDGHMYSPEWSVSANNYLWLDTGLQLEDVLLYRSDLPFIPTSFATLVDTEVLTHIGYAYPQLEPLFTGMKVKRLDKYTELEMIESLLQAPSESLRLMVMERRVWEWYRQRLAEANSPQIKLSPLTIGCASLQIQFNNTPELRKILPALQAELLVRTRTLESPVRAPCRVKVAAAP